MFAKLSHAQATSINLARQHASDKDRKAVKKELFAAMKDHFGIPTTHKLVVETEDSSKDNFLILRNKANDQPYKLDSQGHWLGADSQNTPAAPAKAWFRIPASDVHAALQLHIDDASSPDFDKADALPDNTHVMPGHTTVAFNTDGDAFVQLNADHLD